MREQIIELSKHSNALHILSVYLRKSLAQYLLPMKLHFRL